MPATNVPSLLVCIHTTGGDNEPNGGRRIDVVRNSQLLTSFQQGVRVFD